MRLRPLLAFCLLLLAAAAIASRAVRWRPQPTPPAAPAAPQAAALSKGCSPAGLLTRLYAHNLELRQGPVLKIYIPWVRGQMVPTTPCTVPSLDHPESFLFHINRGVVRLQLGDLARFLNSGSIAQAPFHNVSLDEQGGDLVMHATVHRVVPLRIELRGRLTAARGNLVALHVKKLRVLKVPMFGVLSAFHLTIGDLLHSHASGIQIVGNTVYFNARTLPPAPHIDGDITSVRLIHDSMGPAIDTIYYGSAKDDPVREEQWRDFLQLSGGSLSFGRLTMRDLDLILIDKSAKDPWFDLDLPRYQTQLVYGITRITPQAGLQIFMPSLDQLPNSRPSATITREWLQNRNLPSPPSVPVH